LINDKCNIVFINQSFKDIFGYEEKEIVDHSIDIISECDLNKMFEQSCFIYAIHFHFFFFLVPETPTNSNDNYIREFIEKREKTKVDGKRQIL
jgi:PAS domain-containing protein